MMILKHSFVDNIPDQLENGIIYISIPYCTAIHKCVCGCNNEVVTPISPTDWKLTFDGESISLYPSIGNWSFECKSHYWVRNGKIEYAKIWSEARIEEGRQGDKKKKKNFFRRRKKKG